MRAIIILLTLATMAGCASTQQMRASAPPSPNVTAFATLASFGSFEWELAPAYTALARARHNAAAKLRAGRITVDEAQSVQDRANIARAHLDRARDTYAMDEGGARKHMLAAHEIIATLEGKP